MPGADMARMFQIRRQKHPVSYLTGRGEGASYVPYWRHIKNHVAAHAVHLEPSLENPDGNEQDVLEDSMHKLSAYVAQHSARHLHSGSQKFKAACREEKSLRAS